MEIVKLTESDWRKFKELRLEAIQNDGHAFGSSYQELMNLTEKEWKEKITKPKSFIFIAKDNDDFIGMAAAYQEEGEKLCHIAYIWGVYVRDTYRRKGVGRQLMEAILSALKSSGEIEKANLNTTTTQTGALKLYQSLGFTITGTSHREIKIDGKYFDEHAMEIIF